VLHWVKVLKNDFSNQKHYRRDARVFGLMANAKRLHILDLLAEREMSVAEIIAQVKVPKANVSQHLRILKDMHFVKSRRDGSRVFYKIRSPLVLIMKTLFRHFSQNLAH
jgi:ArsR family transcriptional regulator, virulence genes transcriptional regulator